MQKFVTVNRAEISPRLEQTKIIIQLMIKVRQG